MRFRALLLALSAAGLVPSEGYAQEEQEPAGEYTYQDDAYDEEEEYLQDPEEEAVGYIYLDDTVVTTALDEVMSRPEFQRLRVEPEEPEESETPAWVERFFEWLDSWLGGDGDETEQERSAWFPGGGLLNLIVYGATAILLFVVIMFIAKAITGSGRSRKLSAPERAETIFRPDAAPGEISPGEYWRRALAHGDAGDYRSAVREILLATMSTIERRGLIRFRKGLTNRDYFFAVRGAPREAFATIAEAFELIYFGRREATADNYRACRQAFEKSFRLEQAT